MLRHTRIASLTFALGLSLAVTPACKKEDTTDPEVGSNLIAGGAGGGGDDDFSGGEFDSEYGDEFSDEEGYEEEGEVAAASELPKLPPKAQPKKRCRGKGKKRKCKFSDPKPKVSAAYGVRTLMGDFRWGMSRAQVLKVLAKDIETEYNRRQKKAQGAMDQDNARKWRGDQIQALKSNTVAFTTASKHRWGVSLVQFEYENDSEEEMIWIRSSATLRKFYFFKNNELWKIFYAYSIDTWPGKPYDEVKEQKLKKWFGHSPQEKVKQNKDTASVAVKYTEWTALNNEKIRAFDMTGVHGVVALAVVDGTAERNIGERLPNTGKKEEFGDDVSEILGDTDVCYDNDGNISQCTKGGFGK